MTQIFFYNPLIGIRFFLHSCLVHGHSTTTRSCTYFFINYLFYRNSEGVTLSVEYISFIFFWIIKTFIWEILYTGTIFFQRDSHSAGNDSCLVIINEMVMRQCGLMKEVTEDIFLIKKCASNKGIWEQIDRYCMIIDSKLWIDVKLFFLNFLLCSAFSSKCSKLEVSIIDVRDGKVITYIILFYFL